MFIDYRLQTSLKLRRSDTFAGQIRTLRSAGAASLACVAVAINIRLPWSLGALGLSTNTPEETHSCFLKGLLSVTSSIKEKEGNLYSSSIGRMKMRQLGLLSWLSSCPPEFARFVKGD